MSNEIEGLAQLQRQLAKLKKVSPHSLLAGALVLQKYAMQNAPVKTGFLRNSATARETDKGAELAIQANYAYYVEFGTSKMAAQPYVRPAIDEHSHEVVEAVGKEIENEIKGKL